MDIYLSIFIWIVMGAATAYVAKERGRDPIFWFVVGLLLGLIGLIIVFILPASQAGKNESPIQSPSSFQKPPITDKDLPSRYLHKQWFYLSEEQEQKGPFTFEELRDRWREKIIKNDSFVWCEEMPEWKTVEELKLF